MAVTSDIQRAENEVNSIEEDYTHLKRVRKLLINFGLAGLACGAYLGARAIFGANIREILNMPEPETVLQTIDQIACSTGAVLLLGSGGLHLLYNIIERDNRRDRENAEENLRRMQEDYSFSRGHL